MFKQVIDNDKQSHFIQVTADTDDTPFVNILSQYSDNATDASYELYDRSVQGYLNKLI